MTTKQYIAITAIALSALTACNSKPKPVSNDISKTTVTVNGKKDSVINNPEKNYTTATLSEPCVTCVLGIIQATDSYKKMTSVTAAKNIIYDVNWITSKTPKDIGNGKQIINGLDVDVKIKGGGASKNLTTYLYDNQNAQFYLLNGTNNYAIDSKIDSVSAKTIRRKCFWDVASAK